MTRAFAALAWNGFREARRNRVSVVVGIFVVALILCTSLVADVTVWTFERVLTDFGLGSMSIALTLLAIFLSSSLLAKEIERRTAFLVVSKPISRGLFIVGRLSGNMLTLAVLLIVMSAMFFAEYKSLSYDITTPQLQAVGMLWMELLVVSSIGFVMSAFAGQMVSAIVTIGIYFAGHLSADIYNLAAKSPSLLVQWVGKATYFILPNLSRLNFRPAASYNVVTPIAEVLKSIVYGFGYACVMVGLAIAIFNRRDFK